MAIIVVPNESMDIWRANQKQLAHSIPSAEDLEAMCEPEEPEQEVNLLDLLKGV